ncbi:MAG TPA: alpha-2-macroglobulin family protein [Puia sp.]|nr:alpha-2-macroglobulin family protein [Puia sp.]
MLLKKYILAALCSFLLSTLLSAQVRPDGYDARWQLVDSLFSKKGLTQSALGQVNKIYADAKKEKNDAQLIKALVYRMNLRAASEEDATQKSIGELEKETASAQGPTRSILSGILAGMYWDYLKQNRYKFYNRTKTSGFKKEDLATWDLTDLHKRIGELYLYSILDERSLWQTKLASFGPVIIKGNVSYLRPTLFDLLAHQALEYFKSDEQDLAKPAYAFEIGDTLAFAPIGDFAAHRFRTEDSLSLHFHALQLFQRLMLLHQNDARQTPLVDLDIERMQFVYQYAVMENKDALYLKALSDITGSYVRDSGAGELSSVLDQAWYLQAQQYANRAIAYRPAADTTGRYAYVTAKAICEKVLTEKDSSEGNTNCQILLKSILRKTLILETEKVNTPGQPFRSLLSWRNFSKAWFRVVKMDRKLKEGLGNTSWEDDYWKRLRELPVVRAFDQVLPGTGDYQNHRVEIKIDALPTGEYALIASADKDFSLGNNVQALQYFYVSSISLVNFSNNCFVLNRETGQPLAGATIQAWDQAYDYKIGGNRLTKAATYQADEHGYVLLKEKSLSEPNRQQLLEISTSGDHFFPDDHINTHTYNATDAQSYQARTFFFTDRSIYRPGQTVYFKGIVVVRDTGTKQSKIVPHFRTKVILYDVNGQKLDSLQLTTNEYGSYHGKFTLPEHLLNGEFRLEDDLTDDQQPFSVEEYKRPKFYIGFEKLKGSYRPGDSVRVSGAAKAYAGNNIGGARIKYRVARVDHFPYTGHYLRTENSGVGSQEIAHGEAFTQADGSFFISFTALPNNRISKAQDPSFEYRVSADITDIDGETRSGQLSVVIGYKALQLSISLPMEGRLPADSLKVLAVQTSNLSGEPEAAPVTMNVYRLKNPGRMIRRRYWAEPDQFVMSREQFLSAFPHDVYGDDDNIENWEREPVPVASASLQPDSLRPGLSVKDLRAISFRPAWYRIEATAKDKWGQEVKAIRYLELYDGRTGQPASPQYQWGPTEVTVEPGDKAIVNLGSSAGGLFVIRKVERDGDKGFGFFTLDNGRKSMEYPVTEADRGGFIISDIFVKENRCYLVSHRVTVPWTNKELTIGYTSFRDKTLPGSEEKWQVKISGHKGDKAVAELLAGMYDASLDAFKIHEWYKPDLYPEFIPSGVWNTWNNFYSVQSQQKYEKDNTILPYRKEYDHLLGVSLPQQRIMIRGMASPMAGGGQTDNSQTYRAQSMTSRRVAGVENAKNEALEDVVVIGYGTRQPKLSNPDAPETTPPDQPSGEQAPVQVRKNFAETAFFFPDLHTDSAGNASFSFTMPEAVTRWKWMTLAHTKDLAFGYSEKNVVTSKQLMVQPNAPRFLREGDRMELTAKVVNLTDKELTGQMELQLTDPTSNQSVDGWFSNRQANQYFTVGAGQSSSVGFSLEVPYQYNRPVTYRLVAKAGSYSDGEESTLPVVSNRMLVTESLPLNLPGNGTRNFQFDKLLKSAGSETLNHHALTVEFTSNPAWYAVLALPYLMEYPYECAEQTFNRFYANALASAIVSNSPRIRKIFEKWKTSDTAALLSNLEKNQELKSVLLEETPWVLQAKSETQQKKNIALLFDMARMTRELEGSLQKLQDMQSPDGGFVWFKGGPDDRYITQLILTGIGHLQKLNALPATLSAKINALVTNALPWLDKKIKEDFDNLKAPVQATTLGQSAPKSAMAGSVSAVKGPKTGAAGAVSARGPKPATGSPKIGGGMSFDNVQAQYLYMRSFFSDHGIPGDVFPAVNYYRKQAQQSWLQAGRYMQGMIALALYRTGDPRTAKDIMASLRQNAIRDEEKGMYWKDMRGGYYWYQAPIETQSLLIEAFREVAPDAAIDRELRTWLLKQKQTRDWSTTRATADACYALLLGGQDWLSEERNISIRLGDKLVSSDGSSMSEGNASSAGSATGSPTSGGKLSAEAGTGYFKKIFDGPFVTPSMGNISVTMSSGLSAGATAAGASRIVKVSGAKTGATVDGSPAWGAVYWQYFENLDKIVPPDPGTAPLKLNKKIFIEKNTDRGPVLEPVSENGVLHVGDKLRIRIELRSDRDLEYVHMKDMRASCTEPVNVLSGYIWQGGLSYYETTKDIATDFFFSRLPRGVYVFEYPLFVAQNGNFSNGVTSIQCMYAPEFGFHSEGIRVNVEVNP